MAFLVVPYHPSDSPRICTSWKVTFRNPVKKFLSILQVTRPSLPLIELTYHVGDCANCKAEHYYPRDAMLARVFAIATCPSVCLSVCLSVRLSAARRYCA